jgi:hypothetical protein
MEGEDVGVTLKGGIETVAETGGGGGGVEALDDGVGGRRGRDGGRD